MSHHKKSNLYNFFFPIKKHLKRVVLLFGAFFLVLVGIGLIWVSSLKLPNLDSFDQRKISSSTKILDRTEEIVLFDVHEDFKRTLVEGDEISVYAKNAAVAIEDDQFYEHRGIDVRAILRAVLANITKAEFSQGGSTITQQVIKNTLLVNDKRISRKIKEWFLAVKLEQKLTKDEILTTYLNVVPYGGTIYGIEQASQSFFGKGADEITLAEAAYLAALPNAPSFYSPYGKNKDRLDIRKDLVLKKMLELDFIDAEAYETAKQEEVEFLPREEGFAKALHFVEYVRAYLEERYGSDAVINDGLRVVTTLDYELQKFAEEAVLENALENQEKWNASNQAAVVIDPKTGQILTMVGSRDYFDEEIDGKFNVAIAERQPGSSFKPFIYARAFEEGYTPETILFDTKTQFTASCPPTQMNSNGNCYAPANYDNDYTGPVTLRGALGASRNVPAVKLLYLVGINDALRFAKNAGISTLDQNGSRYGLTLVLGGGEVTLLDMTSAYGVFGNGGVRNAPVGILRVEDKNGNVLEEYRENPQQTLDRDAVATLNDVLSDNQARLPLFGTPNNFMYFGEGQPVAAKTGTTNNSRDGWLLGYTPDIAVGVWTGNNDNTPMKRGSAISGPTWRAIMNEALKKTKNSSFEVASEKENQEELKPVLRGVWRGGDVIKIDSISGGLATEYTPPETTEEVVLLSPHSILHWLDKNNPLGPAPENPAGDSQYRNWEWSVQNWVSENKETLGIQTDIPNFYDNVHTLDATPEVEITSPLSGAVVLPNQEVEVAIDIDGKYSMERAQYFVNDVFIGSSDKSPFTFVFEPSELDVLSTNNTLKVVVYDKVFNKGTAEVSFSVK